MAPAPDPSATPESLATAIGSVLADGIRLTASDLAFIASAFDAVLPRDLPAMLAAPADWDAEPLVALVFSADDAARERLLPAIQAAMAPDAGLLISDLTAAPPRVTGRLPDGSTVFCLQIPADGIRHYVESLKVTRRIPAADYLQMAAILPERRSARLLSRLRLSRIDWNRTAADLLLRFFETLGRYDDAEALLGVLIEVLETGPAETAEAALGARKRACFRALSAADRFNEDAGRHNMETLMMMGVRPPAVSAADARRQMNRIDRVSMAVFGRSEFIAPEAMSLSRTAVGAAGTGEDPMGPID